MKPHQRRLLPFAAVLALVLPLLWALALPGVYVGNGTDFFSYQLPMRAMAEAAGGLLQPWNPYVLAGVPAHAGMQLGFAYPPNLLTQLLPAGVALTASLVLHLALLGLGAQRLARAWLGERSLAADLALTAVLVGSGATWGHVFAGHVSFVQAWAWVPWIWAGAIEALRGRRPGPLLAATGALGLQMLAGHPQVTYLALCGLAPVLLLLGLQGAPQTEGTRLQRLPGSLLALGILALLGAGGFALAAVQWLPTLALAPELNRSLSTPLEIATAFSAPPRSLWTALAPDVWGGPQGPALAGFSYHETLAWATSAGLALAGLGALRSGWRGGAVVVALTTFVLLSVGEHAPLLPALVGLLPGAGSFRVPGRWLLPAVLLLGLLAAEGARVMPHTLRAKLPPRQTGLVWVGALLLGGGALVAAGAAAGLQTGSGWWANAVRDAVRDKAAVPPQEVAAAARAALWIGSVCLGLALVAWLKPLHQRWIAPLLVGVALLQGLWFGARHVGPAQQRPLAGVRWTPSETAALQTLVQDQRLATAPGLREANRGGAAGVRVAGGYEPAVTVLSNRYGNLLSGRAVDAYAVQFQVRRPSPWLDRMATSHFLHDARDDQAARAFAAWPVVAGADPGRMLRRNPAPIQRISWAQAVRVEPDARAAVMALGNLPASTVVLARELPLQTGAGGALTRVTETTMRLELQVTATGPSVLVVRDTLASGWLAEVDGVPVPLVLADGLFRALAVPAGNHVVTLRYEAPGLHLGLLVSGLAWLLALAAAVVLWRRRPGLAHSSTS